MVSVNVEIFSVSSVAGFLNGDQVCRVLNMAIDWRTPKYFSRAGSLQRLLLWPFINWRIRRYVTDSNFAGFVFQDTEWTAWLDRFFHGYEINEIIVKIAAEPKVGGGGVPFVGLTDPVEAYAYLKFKYVWRSFFFFYAFGFSIFSFFFFLESNRVLVSLCNVIVVWFTWNMYVQRGRYFFTR